MQQLNLYVQEVIKENAQLQMRLQFEERNNQMLLKQLNHARAKFARGQGQVVADGFYYRDSDQHHHAESLFQNDSLTLFEQQHQIQESSYVRQPRKPSGKIDQKLNQKDITFENNSDGITGLHTDVVDGLPEGEADDNEALELNHIKTSPRFNEDQDPDIDEQRLETVNETPNIQ